MGTGVCSTKLAVERCDRGQESSFFFAGVAQICGRYVGYCTKFFGFTYHNIWYILRSFQLTSISKTGSRLEGPDCAQQLWKEEEEEISTRLVITCGKFYSDVYMLD
jgi:hypothetical protein